ncbi:MAG: CotH kinase family protein [Myxococcota bacterium]
MTLLLLGCAPEARLASRDLGSPEVEDAGDVIAPPEEVPVGPNRPTITPATLPPGFEPEPVEGDDAVTGDPGPWDPSGDFLYDDTVVHEFSITLDDDAIDDLYGDPATDVAADFTFEGATWHDVGLKLKGSWSFRTLSGKAAFKIDFGELVPGLRFRGVRRLTLNNMLQDRSMLHEHVVYWLAANLGIPAPRHAYARVYVNGELFGLYGVVESMDEQFVARAYAHDPGGNLYEGSGDDFTYARNHYEVEEPGEPEPYDELDDLVEALERASGDELLDVYAARFDRDALFRYLALDAVAGHGDGYVFNHHNYMVYRAPLTDRWWVSPWGTDQTFEKDTHVHGTTELPVDGALVYRCLADDACEAVYDEAIRAMADHWEAVDVVGYARDTFARIEADCEADPRRESSCEAEDLFDFLAERPDRVRSQVD